MSNSQQPVINITSLPKKDGIYIFDSVQAGTLVEFNSDNFATRETLPRQIAHILKRAEQLNSTFNVFQLGSMKLGNLVRDTYLMKFKPLTVRHKPKSNCSHPWEHQESTFGDKTLCANCRELI